MTVRKRRESIEFAGVALERVWRLQPRRRSSADYVPQANDLQRVFDLVWKAQLEIIDSPSVAEHFGFDPRQALYYIEACKELGLIEKFGPDTFRLTPEGFAIRGVNESAAITSIAEAVLGVPVILRVLSELRQSPKLSLPSGRLRDIVAGIASARYGGSTLPRRIECVGSWLRWLENNSEFLVLPPEIS